MINAWSREYIEVDCSVGSRTAQHYNTTVAAVDETYNFCAHTLIDLYESASQETASHAGSRKQTGIFSEGHGLVLFPRDLFAVFAVICCAKVAVPLKVEGSLATATALPSSWWGWK